MIKPHRLSSTGIGAATYQEEAVTLPKVSRLSDVEEAIWLGCKALGRKPGKAEEQLVERLRDNWFENVQQLLDMSEAEAAAVQMPLRLRKQIIHLCEEAEKAEAAAEAVGPPPPPSEQLLASSAGTAGSEAKAGYGDNAAQNNSDGSSSSMNGTSIPPSSTSSRGSTGPSQDPGPPAGLELPGPSSSSSSGSASDVEVEQGEQQQQQEEEEEEEDLHEDIMQRRCPPLRRFAHGRWTDVKVTKRKKLPEYAIKESEMGPALAAELQRMYTFSTQRSYGQQTEPLLPVTATKYIYTVRQALGWLHRVEGVPLDKLSMTELMPTHEAEGARHAFNFVQWQQRERQVGMGTLGYSVLAMIQVARFLYHTKSKASVARGDKPYSDLGVIKELRALCKSYEKGAKVASSASDESLKWLDWPQYQQLVQELRKECAGLDHRGRPRKPHDVAHSLQTYLIFAILSCIPDRQRTIRQLELGRTLIKGRDGRWFIQHSHADYKTGKTYGDRPALHIAPYIYPELEAYLTTWRKELNPQHNYVFTKTCGKPLDRAELSRHFSITAFRITGKRTNPHLIRDMVVTYFRDGNATEHELQALALYMGHSIEMQRNTYDRRTLQQKVEPAVGLLQTINARALTGKRAAQ